jgi:hypothetical protein
MKHHWQLISLSMLDNFATDALEMPLGRHRRAFPPESDRNGRHGGPDSNTP